MALHPHDPGTYTIKLYTARGRRREWEPVAVNFQRAQSIAARWRRRTGGSSIVMRCVYNDGLGRPTYSSRDQ